MTRVRVPTAARDFSLRVNFQCRLSYGVRTAPSVQSLASTAVRTLTTPNTGSHIPLLGQKKIAHTLMGMGSAALAAAVRGPEFPAMDKEALKNRII